MNARGIRKSTTRKFYFIRPRKNADAGELAERLLELKPVEQVFVTDGTFGFIVRARLTNNREPTEVADYISKNIDSRFGQVMSYFEYKK